MPAALEHALIGRITHQRVLEAVDGFRRLATTEHEPGLLKLGQSMLQCGLVASNQRAHQGIRELASDCGAELGDLPHRSQPVEPRHQRVLKRLRDGERWQRPLEPIDFGVLNQDARFQHCLSEFFDEQWVPVGLGDDLFHHFDGEHAPCGHARDHVFNVVGAETTERQAADIGETNPRRLELRSEGKQRQDR